LGWRLDGVENSGNIQSVGSSAKSTGRSVGRSVGRLVGQLNRARCLEDQRQDVDVDVDVGHKNRAVEQRQPGKSRSRSKHGDEIALGPCAKKRRDDAVDEGHGYGKKRGARDAKLNGGAAPVEIAAATAATAGTAERWMLEAACKGLDGRPGRVG
jgi:hypothetical protein